MDYPYERKTRYNASNNFWFLPTDLFKTTQEKEQSLDTLRNSPMLAYLDEISPKNKFTYIILTFAIILLAYRLSLHWSIWVGLIIGLIFVYYLNERRAQELNNSADQLWAILKSPLLKNTKYFITDPQFIQWVSDVSEFKSLNRLEFNKMISSLDKFLKLIYNLKIGVHRCKENIDLIQGLKVQALNQFHSIIYKINNADLRKKINHYFNQLGKLLNERHSSLIRICKLFYTMKPIDIESRLDITSMNEPSPNDTLYDSNYNFYN